MDGNFIQKRLENREAYGKGACAKMIRGYVTDYAYCGRNLSVSDFEQFDYDSTYGDKMFDLFW